MRLVALSLEQVKQFRRPFTLAGLTPGINLITGPNESGKSTLVQAIRAVFFERYGSGSVSYLQPWGDSSAAPEISLEFEVAGEIWRLHKRYLKRKRCDLAVADQSFSNDDAEERLAQLLGFQYAGRGASKPEHWGIPGLLWVEQGSAQELEEPVTHAGSHLQSALTSLLGEVSGSGGDDIIRAVSEARGELLTRTGKARGEYERCAAECADLRDDLAELDAAVTTYRAEVDRLGELRTRAAATESEQPWAEYSQRAAQVQEQLDDIAGWQQEQSRQRQYLDGLQRTLAAWMLQREQAAARAQQLRERSLERERAEQALSELAAQTPAVRGAVATAREDYAQAREILRRAREAEKSLQLEQRRRSAEGDVQRLRQFLQRASTQREELERARQQRRLNALDATVVEALESTAAELDELRIRSEAIATRLRFRLLPGRKLRLDEHWLEGEGEQLLLERAVLDLPDLGTLEIAPGGEDLNALRRRQDVLRETLHEHLQSIGVESLAAAREQLRRAGQAQQQEARLEALLKASAPDGIDALQRELEQREEDAAAARTELAALPAAEPAVQGVDAAQRNVDLAADQLRAAELGESEHDQALSRAGQRRDSAQAEWASLYEEERSASAQQARDDVAARIAELGRDISGLQRDIEQRQQRIDGARPEQLRLDWQRLQDSARSAEEEHRERTLVIASLRSRLETQGAQGLEERRDELAAQLAHAQRRHDELERRAQALDLLLDLLQEKRRALTRRLQAPLQKHLNHYLDILFPDAALQVSDTLQPQQFRRGDESGELADLSFGTREQMGLISRLAYADLLADAGRPTLIILDDSMVHSDRARREAVKRILFDAARRHQILLFSCHPEHWQGLGVAARDLPALKAAAEAP